MTTKNTFELLVDKIDGNLSPEQLQQVNELTAQDPSAGRELALLEHTRSGIREAGIYEQVSAIGKSFYRAGTRDAEGPVVSMAFVRKLMKAAAVIIMIGIAATIFKFGAVTEKGTFEKYHTSYQLNTTRAQNSLDEMEAAYRNQEWNQVVTAGANNVNSNKALFLTAMAQMQLGQYKDAATRLQQVLDRSITGNDTYFKDEADYYLAMTFLAMDQADRAIPLLQTIKDDKQHLFNARVQKMSLDLRILQLKN